MCAPSAPSHGAPSSGSGLCDKINPRLNHSGQASGICTHRHITFFTFTANTRTPVLQVFSVGAPNPSKKAGLLEPQEGVWD